MADSRPEPAGGNSRQQLSIHRSRLTPAVRASSEGARVEGISRFCFEASYAVALICELAAMARPSRLLRLIGSASGIAGLLAHTLFLTVQRPTLHSPYGSLLLLAWVLAVFAIYGAAHHPQFAWGVFVLPIVIGFCVLA